MKYYNYILNYIFLLYESQTTLQMQSQTWWDEVTTKLF